jgi:glycosyltransferase involved in cell wall biosynthesis
VSGSRPVPELVSVVLPARNAAATIGQQLAAMARQDYEHAWDVVVADNGSHDGTPEIARAWADRLPRLSVVDASQRPGASFARNIGVAAAGGDFLAFTDADDVVDEGWLTALVAAARDADMVGGCLELGTLNDAVIRTWMGWNCPDDRLAPAQGFLPTVYGSNCGIWRDVLDEVGGWNTRYPHHNDRELSWRVQLASYRLHFAPGAVVHYRLRSNLRVLWTKSYRDAVATVQLVDEFGALGAPRTSTAHALRSWAGFVHHLPELVRSPGRRGAYLHSVATYAGRLAGSLRYRTLML